MKTRLLSTFSRAGLLVTAAAGLWLSSPSSAQAQASETDITKRDSDGQTALHKYTVYDWGSLEDVKTLVARGANVNETDNEGCTPLHLAASSGYVDKAGFLLGKGANLMAVNKYGATPFHLAAERRRFDPALLALLIGPPQNSAINLRDREGRTPLFRAVDSDNADTVKWLLDHGADPNIGNARGGQPLDRALMLDYMKVARTLCENGASPTAITEDGMSVLVKAIWRDKQAAIDFLLSFKFDPNAKCTGDRTALHMAATKANKAAAKALLAAGASINAADEKGLTPLDYVDESLHSQFSVWFKQMGAKPGTPKPIHVDSAANDEDGNTPLLIAINKEDLSAVKRLLTATPSLANQPNNDGVTPLMLAVHIGWVECAEVLIAAGADIKAKTRSGRDLFFLAAQTGKLPVLKWAASKGFSVDEPDTSGLTPLITASGLNLECVQWLLEQGARLNARSKSGDTPLTRAITADKLATFRFLIEKGADLGGRDSNDATLLHRASRKRNPEFAKLLLEKSADPNARDKGGLTPLHRAADTKSAIETFKLLLQKGADRTAKDKNGKTPLDYATKAKNEAAIRLL